MPFPPPNRAGLFETLRNPLYKCGVPDSDAKHRRWNVITSGLLIGTLAFVVTFTNRTAFLSPTAVVVVAAVGLMALLLQLRFHYRDVSSAVHVPTWLNALGVLFALAAVLGDIFRVRQGWEEAIALIAVGCFAVSGAIVLHKLRKQRALPK